MKILKPRKKKKKFSLIAAFFVLAALLVPFVLAGVAGYYFIQDMEKPLVVLRPDREAVSPKKTFVLTAEDKESGIRSMSVTVSQGLKKYTVVNKRYDPPWAEAKASFNLEKTELRGGGFEMTAVVRDGSYTNFGNGNTVKITRRMTLDSSTPHIKPLTAAHYVRQGGVGLVIYNVSKDCELNGVVVGDRFFPGFKQESGQYMCLFAFPPEIKAKDFKPRLFVRDTAGNEKQAFFVNMAIKRRFRKEKVKVTDAFLAEKLPRYKDLYPDIRDPVERFKAVNNDLRRQNRAMLRELGKKTSPVPLWDGKFIYLPGGAVRGSFGAKRIYYHNGKPIDEQTHLGIDLASKPKAPVPASNNGRVVYAGPLGVYGKTVVIDHGLGLQTLYAHLGRIRVKAGQTVKKGDVIGNTGTTGLAAADHLHFGVLLSGQEVIPIEWWEAKWLQDNITEKRRRHGELPVGRGSGAGKAGRTS